MWKSDEQWLEEVNKLKAENERISAENNDLCSRVKELEASRESWNRLFKMMDEMKLW